MKTHETIEVITATQFAKFNQLLKEHDAEWMSYHRKKHAQSIAMNIVDYETIRQNYNELKEKFGA